MEKARDEKPEGLIYEGSVKRLWKSADSDGLMRFEFTDDYSIFDWGKMPDIISNKGKALVCLGAFFFEKFRDREFWSSLRKSPELAEFDNDWLKEREQHAASKRLDNFGLSSHFVRLIKNEKTVEVNDKDLLGSGPLFMEVEKAMIPSVEGKVVDGHSLHFYESTKLAEKHLIPLEVVFRFGMPEGSSLSKKLKEQPDYYKVLGLSKTPQEGELFERPVIELFTKLEPSDRRLTWTEAAVMSGLSATNFELMIELTYQIALALYVVFKQKGIQLWDGKFEFICDHSSEQPVKLADSIGPDELRLTYRGQHLSKELVRRLYRNSTWELAVKQAKVLAEERCTTDWKSICKDELNEVPKQLEPAKKKLVDHLYGVLVNHILGEPVFHDHPSLDEFVDDLEQQLSKVAESSRSA